MWVLANQAGTLGRLYWSSQRGWTYLQLASLYKDRADPELPQSGVGVFWFECAENKFGDRRILGFPQPMTINRKREPDCVINVYRDGVWLAPGEQNPPRPWKDAQFYHPDAYRVRVYLKDQAA